jgi:hypothetical protein
MISPPRGKSLPSLSDGLIIMLSADDKYVTECFLNSIIMVPHEHAITGLATQPRLLIKKNDLTAMSLCIRT